MLLHFLAHIYILIVCDYFALSLGKCPYEYAQLVLCPCRKSKYVGHSVWPWKPTNLSKCPYSGITGLLIKSDTTVQVFTSNGLCRTVSVLLDFHHFQDNISLVLFPSQINADTNSSHPLICFGTFIGINSFSEMFIFTTFILLLQSTGCVDHLCVSLCFDWWDYN